jgi:hypothetical protein
MSKKIVTFTLLLFFIIPAFAFAGTVQLPQTGQTTSYAAGDDGDLRAGVAWPDPRFTVSGDCVTDNLTGLMWTKNGNMPGGWLTWQGALDYVANIVNSGAGTCGYSDWRLPNVNELESLVNAEQANNAVWLDGQGFTNVQAYWYWSSSTIASYTPTAWGVHMLVGGVHYNDKSYHRYVWPVRAGQ